MVERDKSKDARVQPPDVKDLATMIAMLDYLIPECRGISPVTTVLLSLARRELITLQINHQEVIRIIAKDL